MSLAWIPRGILSRIQTLCCRFLWKGNQTGRIFAWVKWDALNLPKKWGGWGIKKLEDFSSALVVKLGWQLISSNSLWIKVAVSKNIFALNVMDWIRQPHRYSSGMSIIWKFVLKSLDIIREGITWKIQSSSAVKIGQEPWIGYGDAYRLPMDIRNHLSKMNITLINHIVDPEHSTLFK